MKHGLVLRSRTESLDLSPDVRGGTADLSFDVFGLRRGRPEPIVRLGGSLLRDGSIEIVDGHSNRDVTLIVGLKSESLDRVAEGEGTLWRILEQIRVDRYGELAWTPPGGKAATSVYTILWGDMQPSDEDAWDIRELYGERVVTLSLRCKPFARSTALDVITTDAEFNPSTTVLTNGTNAAFFTDPGSSTNRTAITDAGRTVVRVVGGWYQLGTGSSEWVGGVGVKFPVPAGVGAVSFVYRNVTGVGSIQVQVNGTTRAVSISESLTDGYRRDTVDVSDLTGPLTVNVDQELKRTSYGGPPPFDPTLNFDEISTMAVLPSLSGKATMRALPIKGSARAPGTISVAHAATALGDVLALTAPNLDSGYTPDLRRRRVSGGPTAGSSTAISGSRDSLNGGAFTARVPFALYPDGTYSLIARMQLTADRLLTTRAIHQGVTHREVTTLAASTGGAWKWVVLGTMRLPARAASRAVNSTFDITMTATGAASDDYLDDIFVVPVDAALTLASGITTRRLSLVAPDLDLPRGAVWMHDNADETDAFSALSRLESNDVHELHAGRTLVYVAASGPATPVQVGASYYPHDHTNVTR